MRQVAKYGYHFSVVVISMVGYSIFRSPGLSRIGIFLYKTNFLILL
jgi:hypothetical protein